jgi:hypothetical protein
MDAIGALIAIIITSSQANIDQHQHPAMYQLLQHVKESNHQNTASG